MAALSDIADAVTKASIGVISVSAAIVAIVAVVYLYRTRRREQIVLADIGELKLPGGELHAASASLSPWLRQRVRNELLLQRHNARQLSETVLAGDSGGSSTFALPAELDVTHAETAIAGAAQDTLSALTQPQQTPDNPLSALLPHSPGLVVRTMPLTRGDEKNPRLGLSVEVAELSGPPIAACTFWEPEAGAPEAVQERLLNLMEPVARWIAIRLVAARTEVRSGSGMTRLPADTATAFHRLLVGGLCRTAMEDFDGQAATFADDAGEELRSAAEVLHGYYRPWEMLAGIQEELGRAYLRQERRDDAEAAFRRAQQAWRRAEKLLAGRTGPPEDVLDRLRVRRMKVQVLANRTEGRPLVVQELGDRPLTLESMQMRTLYTTACLYATLAGEFMDDARDAVGRTVLAEPTQDVRTYALRDPELLAIPGLATFLNRLVKLRGQASEPIRGDEAAALITKAKD